MSEKLTKGCVVFMKASSGLTGYGNAQCVSGVCEQLGTVSLYGHNRDYKTYDIDRVVEYPDVSAEPDGLVSKLENEKNLAEAALVKFEHLALQERQGDRAIIDKLVGALEKYGKHTKLCAITGGYEFLKCTCGRDEALALAKESRPK